MTYLETTDLTIQYTIQIDTMGKCGRETFRVRDVGKWIGVDSKHGVQGVPPPNYPPEPPHPEPVQNPFGNDEPPRDPLQFIQEILQRQQQIDQQRQ